MKETHSPPALAETGKQEVEAEAATVHTGSPAESDQPGSGTS